VLFVVLLSTASKLLGVPTPAVLGIAIVSAVGLAIAGVMRRRSARGLGAGIATLSATEEGVDIVLVDTPGAPPSVPSVTG
jgi:hypothetical protein